MKSNRKGIVLMLAAVFLIGLASAAYAREDEDRTGSPYFFIQSDDPGVDRLPLKSTSADVKISGVMADVMVTQVYANEGKHPLEAIYVFPASTRAAVYGMKMTIGERTVIARIRKRDEARQAYEQAKQEGRSASLLEQQRPNVFQMNVANILPGDRVVVELKYTELLIPTDREYEFVYPTVVGPRYVSREEEARGSSEGWTANPYLHQGELPPYNFDISLAVSTGLAIRDMTCPSHKVDIEYQGPAQATLRLKKSETSGGNRDFICRYRLSGDRIESGLLLSRGAKENFFLLMVQPPKRIKADEIPPREYVFIVDVSGSMHGFPLDVSKKLLADLIGNLKPTDRFNVLLFSGSSRLMSEQSIPANAANIKRAVATIDGQQGGGGTELLSALKRALSLPGTEGFSRTFIVVTDGYVSVEAESFDLIRNNLGRANLFAFGIGTGVNRHIIEGMARMGMGEPFVITSPEKAPETAERFRHLISYPALTGIQVDYGRFDAYDVGPVSVPDLFADRPIIIYGKWRGKAQGRIEVTGTTGRSRYSRTVDVKDAPVETASQALSYLWARQRIAQLSDYNLLGKDDGRVREVTELGLGYNLLTAYTSFVAIDSEKRLIDGKATTVKQPLPLPQGVSDLAVGGAVACSKAYAPAERSALVETEEKDDGRPDKMKVQEAPVDLRLVKVSASKGLDAEAIKAILEKQLPSIRACMSSKRVAKGEFTITFEIDGQGRVAGVKTDKMHQDMKRCFDDSMKKLRFPYAKDGNRSIVVCTFMVK